MKVNCKLSKIEYKNFFSNSKIIYDSTFFSIKTSKYNVSEPKLVIIIPKKVGSAPYRNYLRRCSKEAFRKSNFFSEKNDYSIFFRPNKKKINFHEIDNIFSLIKKEKVII